MMSKGVSEQLGVCGFMDLEKAYDKMIRLIGKHYGRY